MKKLLIIIFAILLNIACTQVIFAQSFPLIVHVEWTPNPSADAVTNYVVVFNGGAPTNVDPNSCTTTTCRSIDFTIPVAGTYSVSVTAVNYWGSSPAALVQTLVSVPGKSGNVKLSK